MQKGGLGYLDDNVNIDEQVIDRAAGRVEVCSITFVHALLFSLKH